MTEHVTSGPDGPRLAPASTLPGSPSAARRIGRTARDAQAPSRQFSIAARDTRMALAGMAVGLLVVAALVGDSAAFAVIASLIAIAASAISPMVGMIALALIGPVARPLVIPPPGPFVAMVAAMLLGSILRLPVDRPRLRLPRPEVLLLGAFLVYTAAQFLGGRIDGPSEDALSSEIASMFARLTEGVLTFGIAYVVLRGRSPYPVLTAVLASAAITSVLALSELFGAEGVFGNLMDSVGASGRISGPFGNPNYFGAYLASMTALALALALEATSTRVKAILLGLASLLSVTLLFTQSRGALASLIAGCIAIAFVHSRRAGLFAIAGLSLMVVLAYPIFSDWRFEGDEVRASAGLDTAAGRTEAWSAGVDSFLSSPLFGIGLGRFGEGSPDGMAAHNWYVQVLAELGIVGIVIWGLFIVATMMALRRRPRPARAVGYAVLVVWMVAGLTMSSPQEFRMTGAILITVAVACVALWPSRGGEAQAATIDRPPEPGLPRISAGPNARMAARRRSLG